MVEARLEEDASPADGIPETGYGSDNGNSAPNTQRQQPSSPLGFDISIGRQYEESKLAKKEHWDATF